LFYLFELALDELVILLRLFGPHVVHLLRDRREGFVHVELLRQGALVRAAPLQVELEQQAVPARERARNFFWGKTKKLTSKNASLKPGFHLCQKQKKNY